MEGGDEVDGRGRAGGVVAGARAQGALKGAARADQRRRQAEPQPAAAVAGLTVSRRRGDRARGVLCVRALRTLRGWSRGCWARRASAKRLPARRRVERFRRFCQRAQERGGRATRTATRRSAAAQS